MNNVLLDQAKHGDVLSKELIAYLLETMEYNSLGFLNDAIEILKVLRIRIERGDKITDEVSKKVYDQKEFQTFVREHFSEYICKQVFAAVKPGEKVYFRLEACEGGYELVMSDKTNKVYHWISSLNEKFSLVYMRATKIVYIKNMKENMYTPFISENGKFCRYDEAVGKILEV